MYIPKEANPALYDHKQREGQRAARRVRVTGEVAAVWEEGRGERVRDGEAVTKGKVKNK